MTEQAFGRHAASEGSARDPVCGMTVDVKTVRLKSEHDGRTFYFCSAGDKSTFDKDPQKYAMATHSSWGSFVRHFFSMSFPMMAGCGVTCYLAFGVLGLPLNVFSVGVLFALVVTINMTVPMALWMRYLMHHSWKSTNEMSALMFAPLVFLIPYSVGLVPGLLLCPLICASMFPLMLGLMLYHRNEYGMSHASHMLAAMSQ